MSQTISATVPMLLGLLSAAGWHGNTRRVFEAMPHMSDHLDADDVLSTLDNLNIPTSVVRGNVKRITREDTPLLFIDRRGKMLGLLDVTDSKVLVAEPGQGDPEWKPRWSVRGDMVRLEHFETTAQEVTAPSVKDVASQFSGMLSWLFVGSLLTNTMGLATPLLIMVIYDRVVPSGSLQLLFSLALFMVAILAADFAFRTARARAVAYIGSETERKLSRALVRKIMALHLKQIEQTDVERQMARFKQFESLRDVFTGQVLGSILDLPFVLIFLAVLAWLALPIFFLILALIVIFVLVAVVSFPKQAQLNRIAASEKAALQALMFEMTRNQQAIQRLGLQATWAKRCEVLTVRSARAGRKARQFQMIGQGLSQSMMAAAGVGAIALSTLGAMDGSMSFGALIAVMALVWKVLTPIVALQSGASQIFGFLESRKQADRVLALPEERSRGAGASHQKEFVGSLSLADVTFRYTPSTPVVLSQVSIEIGAKEFVYLAGASQSGRSTLLSMIAGLHPCNMGTIALDGIDTRQIAVDDLRQAITYNDGSHGLFYGTIYQNFRLAAPDISEAEVVDALRGMGLETELAGFQDGIHTRLTEAFRASLPVSTLRSLALARSFARRSPIYMFNNPSAGLDSKRSDALASCLADLKRRGATVMLTSSEPTLLPIADRFLFLQKGRVIVDDVGDLGQRKVQALLEKNRRSRDAA